jgi:hypothetical protein
MVTVPTARLTGSENVSMTDVPGGTPAVPSDGSEPTNEGGVVSANAAALVVNVLVAAAYGRPNPSTSPSSERVYVVEGESGERGVTVMGMG